MLESLNHNIPENKYIRAFWFWFALKYNESET